MEFIYYVPRATSQSTQIPPALAYAFGDRVTSSAVHANGPDGGSGTVFGGATYADNLAMFGVYHDRQTWKPYPGSPYWIGWNTEHPPQPAELIGENPIEGLAVRLGDGNHWQIPRARSCVQLETGQLAPIISLPRRMELTDGCEWVPGGVLQPYVDLFNVAEKWWQFLMQEAERSADSEEISIQVSEAADWCTTVLATNYRVSAVEVWLLDLLNDFTRGDILNAVVDLQTWMDRAAKKNVTPSVNMNSAAGNAA